MDSLYEFDFDCTRDTQIINNQEFREAYEAELAVEKLNEASFLGKKLVVEKAGQKSQRDPSRGPQAEDECFKCKEKGHW